MNAINQSNTNTKAQLHHALLQFKKCQACKITGEKQIMKL